MTHCMPAPAQAARRSLAMTMAAAALAALMTSAAFAQQPPKPAAPPPHPVQQKPAQPVQRPAQAQPAQPQPAQPQQGAQGEMPPLIFSPWTKFCLKPQDAAAKDPNAKEVCFTGKDARLESGQPVLAAVLIEPQGDPTKKLRVTVPLGMQVQAGTRVIVDQGEPASGPYVVCFANGCMADYEVTADLLGKLKKGQNLRVQFITLGAQVVDLAMPLGDFAKAYDGPPTDPKVLEEQQKKLQDQLQERAEKARKEMESRQGAAPGGQPGKTQ
jgi:invasion protein IalB